MVQKKWTIFPKWRFFHGDSRWTNVKNHKSMKITQKKRVKTSLPEKPTPFRILQSFNKTGEVFSWRLSHCLPLCHLRERRHHPEVQVFSMKSFPEDWFASRNKFQVFFWIFQVQLGLVALKIQGWIHSSDSLFEAQWGSRNAALSVRWHVQYSGRPLCRVQRLVTCWYVGFVSYNTFFITLQCTR